MLKDLVLQWFPRCGIFGEKLLIKVTKGVRVMVKVVVSTDSWVLEQGVVDQCVWS